MLLARMIGGVGMRNRGLLPAAAGIACALLAPSVAAAAPAPPLPGAKKYPLVAYADEGSTGRAQTFGAGVFGADSLGAVGPDAISSLRVADGFRVLACDRDGTHARPASDLGTCDHYASGAHELAGSGLDDRVSMLAVLAAPQSGAAVSVFQGPDFTGAQLKLGTGRHETREDRRLRSISSLKVAAGHHAVVCGNTGAADGANPDPAVAMRCGLYAPGAYQNLDARLEGRVTVIGVGGPAVTAAAQPALAGPVQRFGVGAFQASGGQLGQVGDDAISSLRVSAGHRMLACSDDGVDRTLGTCRLFGPGAHDLAGTDLDDAISLLVVSSGPAHGGALTAYRDRDLWGAAKDFGPGLYQADALGTVGNDTVSSVYVHGSARAALCEHDDLAPSSLGVCRLFTPGQHAYIGDDLNDRTSLIAVVR